MEKVACCSNPRLLPPWAAFQKQYFLKGWREKTWQHSRNQHYYSTIARIFSLAFPNIEILEGGEVEIKFLKVREQVSNYVNKAYRVDVFIDHSSNMLIKFQIEIFIFMALIHDSLNTGGH